MRQLTFPRGAREKNKMVRTGRTKMEACRSVKCKKKERNTKVKRPEVVSQKCSQRFHLRLRFAKFFAMGSSS